MNGLYTYKHPTYVSGIRTYVEHQMRVTVVREKGNRYQVKYLGSHASGVAVNTLHWVRKDRVKLDDPLAMPKSLDEAARELKALPDNYRLPYKD